MAQYEVINQQIIKSDEGGERKTLANFNCWITEETRYVDDRQVDTVLTLEGMQRVLVRHPEPDGGPPTRPDEEVDIPLPPVTVSTSAFAGFGWVVPAWGVRAIVQPGGSVKDDLRTAIQQMSTPKVNHVYKHTGWHGDEHNRKYLHVGGGITKSGNHKSIQVRLPAELSRYDLTSGEGTEKDGVRAMIDLAKLGPPEVSWSLLAATLTPLLGPVDFAIHLTGRTGTYKSEVMSLFQSMFGADMDARHLPGSWSSTVNALEAQAYYAKDAPFVIDDFVPAGNSWQIRAYQQTAERIIRAQGNQAGRARLTDVSALQTTMYPRGIVLSTGEDTPEGHSVRARMMMLELSPGDITPAELTKCQNQRKALPVATLGFITWLCNNPWINWKEMAEEFRNKYADIGHARTPSMLGRLLATVNMVMTWLQDAGHMKAEALARMGDVAGSAILKAAGQQAEFLESADPCDQFCASLRHVLQAGLGHLRTKNGGIPKNPTLIGWTVENAQGEMPTYKSHGPTVGWIDWAKDEIWIDITLGYNTVKKAAGSEIALTKGTMLKRLKDSGRLKRTDEARQRNTVRVIAEGHPRQVVILNASQVLETQEAP